MWMMVVQLLPNHLLSRIFVPAVADSVDEMPVVSAEKGLGSVIERLQSYKG